MAIEHNTTSVGDTSGKTSKVVGVGDGMIGKAIDGEGEALLYVLLPIGKQSTKRRGRENCVRQTSAALK